MAKHTDADRKTLYLIDGHAQIFRAYYAIRGGMNSPVTGEPTNASFAFAGMLLKLMEQFHPHYAAMAIDSPGGTFRDEIYPDYKAQRDAPPEDFSAQVPRILEMTRLFGIPVLGKEGAEADDIIATIVERILSDPRYDDVDIRVVSKDKDLEQLLDDRVTMFDIHTDTTIDAEYVQEKKGIRPDQVIDLLTLTGDSSDNIPGVQGVGPKTAAKLLAEYGTLDNLLAHVDEIKGKRRENIEAAAEFLPIARKLVTLDRAVEIGFELRDAEVGGIDAEAVRRLFRQLGFNRHQRDLARLLGEAEGKQAQPTLQAGAGEAEGFPTSLFDAGQGGRAAGPVQDVDLSSASACDYRAITTREELDELVRTLEQQELVAFDTETAGLGHREALCGLSFAWRSEAGVYVPVRSPEREAHLDQATVLEALRPVLENPRIGKCGHNLKYDILVLRYCGVNVQGVAFDSMIGAYLLSAPGQGLDALAMNLLQHETIPISALIGERDRRKKTEQLTLDRVSLELVTPYAAEDADIALRLAEMMRPKLKAMGLERLAGEVEMPLVEVLAEMEFAGIRVEPAVLVEQQEELSKRIEELRSELYEAAGEPFNVDSPKQLAEVLFEKLKLPVVKRTKTGPSTDIEVLERLCEMDELSEAQCRVPRLMVEYRQLTKLVGTYLSALQEAIELETGRIHASFHQTGTATGRLSSSGPNLQNIPVRTEIGRQIRRAFVADEGQVLVSADYSQIELRMLAHLSGDAALIDAFQRGEDIHRAVAAEVFGIAAEDVSSEQRGHAKTINFGIVYGVTAYGLARRIEGLAVAEAKELISSYRARFTGIDRFLGQCIQQATDTGHVETILGRRRAIPQIHSRNGNTRSLGERLAINTVVQGSAADLIKLAMVNLHRRLLGEKMDARMLLQIHDELIVETPEGEAERVAKVVKETMEGAMELKVPLVVEVGQGKDWLEAK
ncbi:MAG: DNA polymerase I [Phycisphaeraceae bacterium]